MSETEDYYFGCWSEAGHYLFHGSERWQRSRESPFGSPPRIAGVQIDCGFCPGAVAPGYNDPRTVLNGAAALHHVGPWTILSFWDNSVDKRPGSHSTFISRGRFTFDAMVERAKAAYPTIWKRYGFEVVPATHEQIAARRR